MAAIFKADLEHKTFWQIFGYALAATIPVSIVGLLVITVIGALDDAITKWQRAGRWWIIFILGFFVSLIYLLCEKKYRRDRQRNKIVDVLIIYLQGKSMEEGKPLPDDSMIDYIRTQLIERIKCWGWSDPTLWSRHYPNEKYSQNIIDIADGAMAVIEKRIE